MIRFVQGVQNHFVLKNQFEGLGHNSVEVNYRKNQLYKSSKEDTKVLYWFIPTLGLCPVSLENL